MNNHDGMITWQDLKSLRREMGELGCGDAALAMFEREPLLGQAIAGRWATIRVMLRAAGVSEDTAKPILRQIIRLIVEAIGLQDRAKEKLLADFMPGADDEDENKHGGDHAR
jgi:hypothetical protein